MCAVHGRSADLPLESAFTFDEQQIYQSTYDAQIKRLARKLSDGKVVWDMKLFRRMILQATWLGFEYCGKVMTAKQTTNLLKDSNTIWRLLKLCNAADPIQYPLRKKDDVPSLVKAVIKGAPKLRTL